MAAVTQLQLIPRAPVPRADGGPGAPNPAPTSTDPTRMVFDHWVFMFGRQAARTKLDAHRRQAINAALALYDGDVQTVMLAVEGMAAVPMADKPQSMQDAMRELTWFLARSERIERCLRYGDQLRDMAAALVRQAADAAAAVDCGQTPAPASDPVAAAAARERLRVLAAQCRCMNG